QNFVHLPMDSTSPFAKPWWYRTTFEAVAEKGRHVVLHFDGINYRANVWLNGKRIADSTQIAGTYRRYALDVTSGLRESGANALAVEIFAPTPADLQTTWVDWNPSPPDKDMGMWQPAYLDVTGDVIIEYPHAVSRVDTTVRSAEVRVGTTLKNLSDTVVSGELSATIAGTRVRERFTLAPRDSSYVELPAAHVANARFWWPAELGRPTLYDLDVSFDVGGHTSDRQHVKVGIREITSEAAPRGGRLFRVNGKRILIRGGGWAPDMFFRPQPARQDAQLAYALDMHLNTIRLEGNYENDRFFERADSVGLLVMAGWVCCDAWEEWPKWGAEQRTVAAASLRDQIRRLRSHPSMLVWLNGSDNPPPADVEQMYLAIERDEHWPNPVVSSASAKPTTVTGASGVKMTGPYDWVPPNYWLQDSTHGGAWAYNTETSPGAAVPPIESIRRMMPERDIVWPLDSVWLFHAAGGQFTHLLDRFNDAMTKRFGAPTSAEDYTVTSQLMTYEGERAMFEAYRRNKYNSTGVIQWMLNNAWPSIYWHLFDWYLRPGGGYFGAKKANELVHAMYSYDDRTVAVINAKKLAVPAEHLTVRLIGLDGGEKYRRDTTFDIPADTSIRLFALPEPAGVSGAYFADIRLSGDNPNLYWLSTTPDVLADTSTWYMTPVKSYADYTALRGMPKTTVRSTAAFSRGRARVTLTNTGKMVAFFVRLQVVGANGDEALPVFWSDNYVSLLPGETRTFLAQYRATDLHGAPSVVVSGWNVERTSLR
ncbi:MAG TPA: glycoside hydrolase family 2 protein, partial [Gemmatimonadaceae bacterium]|nr:glycoside hydrolase family 2 protein [Gemmatimonadaceae bacterium]